jgi:PAS domain S-box-containing protein
VIEQRGYAELFRLAPVAFLVTDAEGTIRDANEAAAGLLNVEARLLPGEPLTGFAAARAVDRALRETSRVAAGVHEQELSLEPRRGRSLRVHAALRLLDAMEQGDRGRLVAWTFLDIGRRAAAERELRSLAATLEARVNERTAELEAERALLETVLAEMPAGVVVAEAPSGRVVRGNEQIAQLLGRPLAHAASLVAYEQWTGYHPNGRRYEPEEWPLVRAMTSGELVSERLEIERADGRRIPVDVTAAPIRDAAGRIVYAVAVVNDASQREVRERAERDFVTNAAHELQTPLTAIISAAEVLEAGAKEVAEDRDRFLAHIRRECDRLARLVQALLTLARAQVGAEPLPLEPVELRPLLDRIALTLDPAAGVEVRVDSPPALAACANRELLEQAVSGLATNAAKYTNSGTIWLAARRAADGKVSIEITDSGQGIPAGDEERVFDRFYRAGERDRTGFGLGLAIVRQAVEALGGEVEVRRRASGGTAARVLVRDAAPEEGAA